MALGGFLSADEQQLEEIEASLLNRCSFS